MQAFTRVLLLSLVVLFTHGTASYAADSGNSTNGGIPGIPSSIEWNNAPLACMPDRAEKWKTPSTNEPCHCPPADFCPNFSDLKPEDIKFNVTAHVWTTWGPWQDVSVDIYGNEISNFNSANVFKNPPTNAILTLAEAKFPKIGWNYQGGHNYGAGPIKVTLFDRSGNVSTYNITTIIEPHGDIVRWIEDNFKMPVGLIGQCCESICPAGSVPTEENVSVTQTPLVVKENKKIVTEDGEDKEIIEEEITLGEPITTTVKTLVCKTHRVVNREGCIKEGTPIITVDGKSKKIEEIKVGDILKGQKGDVTVIALNKFTQDTDEMYGFNGGEAFITSEHPVLTITGWKSIDPTITSVKSDMGVVGKLNVGDKIITKDGIVEIFTIEKHIIKDNATAYNLSVKGGDGFIANDVVVKGFNQVQIHY